MTDNEHKEIILQFLKQHSSLSDLKYSDSELPNQKIVRLVVSDLENHRTQKKSFVYNKDYSIIDPFYEQLFESFTNISFNQETVEFIKNIASEITTREEEISFVLEFFTKPLIATNIDSPVLYFVTSDNSAWDSDIWDETILVPNTVEELLGV
jgi:hypothetical protein